MNEYIILEKDDISIAVDIVEDYAGDQIRGLQQDGFAVVCESTKAHTKDKALKLWSETKKYNAEQLRFKRVRGEATLDWETLKNVGGVQKSYRTKVPGGWLVSVQNYNPNGIGCGVTFLPDPEHLWDGNSLK
ncbi:hypothetical protein [Vibrio parahaemolyticus]|uniref:hypothetical protein n=1 Tax=Vibrio parahaemolyticus TaxID=670 RepID=UPI000A43AC3F|nr:hypothetical protein [Vibrio parahaemolyticus]